jgi:hypothetical protein
LSGKIEDMTIPWGSPFESFSYPTLELPYSMQDEHAQEARQKTVFENLPAQTKAAMQIH